ncbi:MAG: COG4223 family protein [Cognatishimia sp.]
MAKADKTDVSTDKNTKVETEVTEDVVDAEIVQETSAETDAPIDPAENSADVREDQENPKDETADVKDVETSEQDAAEDDDTADAAETGDADEQPLESDADPESDQATEAADSNESDASQEDDVDDDDDFVEDEFPIWKDSSEKSGPGLGALLLGGAATAAIGFGAAIFLGLVSSGDEVALTRLSTELRTQSKQIETLSAQYDEASGSASAAQTAANTLATSVDDSAADIAAFNGRIDDIVTALADIDARLVGLEKRPISQGLPSSAIQAYERELEALKSSVSAQRAEAAAMQENAKVTARDALARAALSRVTSAIDSGAPFRTALSDFSVNAGLKVPDALIALADSGVPTLASLQASYPASARQALAVARSIQDDSENRFAAFMKSQLGARSVAPKDGQDADAILSRAEDSLRTGDVSAALDEIAKLPQEAQDALAGWVSEAKTRIDAAEAAANLMHQLNAN